MKIAKIETFLTNAGLRNYLFVRLTADDGTTGLGEASLEWQEMTVRTLLHEWVEDRVLGTDPADVESVVDDLIRDQYQGGATVMTAISGVEIAMWDLLGKSSGRPVHELLGGAVRDRLPAYANGWYGGARTAAEYAAKAKEVVSRGYRAMKFDPFGVAWKTMTPDEMADAENLVAAVRTAVGEKVELMIEVHGRLAAPCAIEMGRRLVPYRPAWYEEPVHPNDLVQLRQVKQALPFPIAAGERLYMLEEFEQLIPTRACDVVQMDLAHCGGLHVGRRIAELARAHGLSLSPHCSVGPVALCAALHFAWATSNVTIQENFSEYDVPWRNNLVCGSNPIRNGEFTLPDGAGLGIELNLDVCRAHPYRKDSFPSLWDRTWLTQFTQKEGRPA
jgi:galactonate dehydratase